MNLDEVIAANVRRIREEKGYRAADVAARLGVGKHVVYDFERPRAGSAQRQFLWRDIFMLCSVLNVTLFDLVLPPEGEEVDEFPSEYEVAEHLRSRGEGAVADWLERDGRSWLSEILFGIPLTEKDLKTLDDLRRKQIEQVNQILRPFMEEALRMVIAESDERMRESE